MNLLSSLGSCELARIFVDKYLRDYRESIEHSRSDNGVVTESVEAGISKSYLGMQKTGHR